MTLTVCIGASGSGKTTFLNDVHKSHKCTYIRQYHNLRPYIAVSAIPNFDRTKLPYWDIYTKEKKDKSIIIGGTIAGQFMAGLSGGQRKLLLFELIFQRTALQGNLLIVLDEPFAGVTDDFVPFIVARLNEMRKKHNILLVTNDHVNTLKKMADNTVIVSAIDRGKVMINGKEGVDRQLALLAMSIGDEYKPTVNNSDLQFFISTEFSKHGGIPTIFVFAMVAFSLFLLMYWNSGPGSEPLVLIAGAIITFFTAFPCFLQLPDWRAYMLEEAEALLHCSKLMNKNLKACVTLFVLFLISTVQFACLEAVIGTLTTAQIYVGILFDNFSILVPLVLFGLYTKLPDQAVQILGGVPFMFMVFFSTTFSPGSGSNGVKNLRYLCSRFYLWCMLPGDLEMEGCPESNTLLYLILSSLLMPFVFILVKVGMSFCKKSRGGKNQSIQREAKKSVEFAELQLELFGQIAYQNLSDIGNTMSHHEKRRIISKRNLNKVETGDTSGDNDNGVDNLVSSLDA